MITHIRPNEEFKTSGVRVHYIRTPKEGLMAGKSWPFIRWFPSEESANEWLEEVKTNTEFSDFKKEYSK